MSTMTALHGGGGTENSPILRFCKIIGKYLNVDQNNCIMTNITVINAEEEVTMKKGFTLAEVLITLGIIGIVAAMTMPSLVANHRKKETAIKVKKAYSLLSQVFQRSIADNGDPINWEFEHDIPGASQKCGDTYIAPYLNVIKRCGASDEGDCETKILPLNGGAFAIYSSRDSAKYFLKDGSMIVVKPNVYDVVDSVTGETIRMNAIRIYVDINGAKKPNTWGKDFFYFVYMRGPATQYADVNGRFLPNGSIYSVEELLSVTTTGNACHKNNAGWGCASLIMKQNWEITEDYPW